MFRRLPDGQAPVVTFTIDGRSVTARTGDSVAAALLANGVLVCRQTPISEAPRAPFCLMGVCFECLVRIDGIGSRQACMTPVRNGMQVEIQVGKREAGR